MKLFNAYIKLLAKYFFIIALLCHCVSYAFHYLYFLKTGRTDFIDWKLTQYAVNYFEYGFIKRGLVGTFVALLPPVNLAYLMIFINSLLFCVLSILCFVSLKHTALDARARAILLALYAISPFTAFQFSYDAARFDILNLVLIVLALFFLHRGSKLGALLVVIVATLIHEAFVVYGVPLIIAAYFYYQKPGQHISVHYILKDKFFWCYSSIVLLLSVIIFRFGNNASVANSTVGDGAQVWGRGLLEISLGVNWIETFVLLLILSILYSGLYGFYKHNKGRFDLLFFAPFAPLCLFLLGIDCARWCALIFANIFIVMALKIRTENWVFPNRLLCYGWAVFLLPLGAVGITFSFPFVQTVAKTAVSLFAL